MANTVIVKQGQTLLDIALQTTGSAESVFALAEANNISITERLNAGDELVTVDVDDASVVAYLQAGRYELASWPDPEGIGYWIIEETFTVS